MNDVIVNTTKLKAANQDLFNLIKKYEENKTNLFYLFSSLDKCWGGEDQKRFLEIMKLEEEKYNQIIKKLNDIYKYCDNVAMNYDTVLTKIENTENDY